MLQRGSEYLGDVARHQAAAAESAIVLGRRKLEIAAGRTDGEGEMLEAVFHAGAGVEQPGASAAITNATGGGTFHLEDAKLAMAAPRVGIVPGFDLGDAQREPGGNPIGGRHRLDHGNDSAMARRNGKSGTAMVDASLGVVPDLACSRMGQPICLLVMRRLGVKNIAAAAVPTARLRRYSEYGHRQTHGQKACKNSLLHDDPFLFRRRAPINLQLTEANIHATADVRVKDLDKPAKCVLNMGAMLQCNIDFVLLHKRHAKG